MTTPLWQRLAALGGRASSRGPRMVTVPFEQAVYGSFAFRHDGYAFLAQSPGCRAEWLQALRAACQKLGERPAGVIEAAGLFTLRPSDAGGVWAIVGMSPQGYDDQGRPGALGFHALFLTPGDFAAIDHDPFPLAAALRTEWSADVTALPSGFWSVVKRPDAPHVPAAESRRAARIRTALTNGRRVLIESAEPIDALAREVWSALPSRVRARASLATWAFANTLRFDLVAVPRLGGIELDASYLDPHGLDQEDVEPQASPQALTEPGSIAAAGVSDAEAVALGPGDEAAVVPGPARSWTGLGWRLLALGLMGLLGGVGVAVALRGDRDDDDVPPPVAPLARPAPDAETTSTPGVSRDGPPEPGAFPESPEDRDPLERRRVAEVLLDLSDRCEVVLSQRRPDVADPVVLMVELAKQLRYHGPWLSEVDRADLAARAESDREAALALRWDDLVRRFQDDRPLSDSQLRAGSLRWQLALLAWSFHGSEVLRPPAEGPRRSPSEDAQAIREALAVEVSLRPGPMVERYPALGGYLSFLARLPRR